MRAVLLITLLLLAHVLPAQSDWELNKNKNGIQVFTARENSAKQKSVKVEAVFKGTLQRLLKILMDVDNNKTWVYNNKESRLVSKAAAYDILYYAETELPWPMSNRDVVIRMQFDLDETANTLHIKASGIPDAVSRKQGLVRIPYFEALWHVTFNGHDTLRIQYLLSVDPGGNVPAAVSNLFITKGPYETFKNLSELLKK